MPGAHVHVDDCADACIFLLRHWSAEGHVNVGSGEDLPILELAHLVADIVGFGAAGVYVALSYPDYWA